MTTMIGKVRGMNDMDLQHVKITRRTLSQGVDVWDVAIIGNPDTHVCSFTDADLALEVARAMDITIRGPNNRKEFMSILAGFMRVVLLNLDGNGHDAMAVHNAVDDALELFTAGDV